MSASARDRLIEKLRSSLDDHVFVKLTLSEPIQAPSDLRNVYLRPVEIRGENLIQRVERYARKDITKNLAASDCVDAIRTWLEQSFQKAYLFTTVGDWYWRGPGGGTLKARRPSFAVVPSREHDRAKKTTIDSAPWLVELGVTNRDNTVRPGMADKLRQIRRFAELLEHLIEESPLKDAGALDGIDLGSGKGYLTFAAYDFLRARGKSVQMTGVEIREELVLQANAVARNNEFDGLEFVHGDVASFEPRASLDILVALHACNTATDDALALGVRSEANLILVSPCCHQEVRPQIVPPSVLRSVLKHGILLERYAEIISDAVRALILEIHGYKTKVFEFISSEHSGKNLMITAQKQTGPRDAELLRSQLRDLVEFHGIRAQRLAQRLGEL
jgi:SAM-dependent methyltransferase